MSQQYHRLQQQAHIPAKKVNLKRIHGSFSTLPEISAANSAQQLYPLGGIGFSAFKIKKFTAGNAPGLKEGNKDNLRRFGKLKPQSKIKKNQRSHQVLGSLGSTLDIHLLEGRPALLDPSHYNHSNSKTQLMKQVSFEAPLSAPLEVPSLMQSWSQHQTLDQISEARRQNSQRQVRIKSQTKHGFGGTLKGSKKSLKKKDHLNGIKHLERTIFSAPTAAQLSIPGTVKSLTLKQKPRKAFPPLNMTPTDQATPEELVNKFFSQSKPDQPSTGFKGVRKIKLNNSKSIELKKDNTPTPNIEQIFSRQAMAQEQHQHTPSIPTPTQPTPSQPSSSMHSQQRLQQNPQSGQGGGGQEQARARTVQLVSPNQIGSHLPPRKLKIKTQTQIRLSKEPARPQTGDKQLMQIKTIQPGSKDSEDIASFEELRIEEEKEEDSLPADHQTLPGSTFHSPKEVVHETRTSSPVISKLKIIKKIKTQKKLPPHAPGRSLPPRAPLQRQQVPDAEFTVEAAPKKVMKNRSVSVSIPETPRTPQMPEEAVAEMNWLRGSYEEQKERAVQLEQKLNELKIESQGQLGLLEGQVQQARSELKDEVRKAQLQEDELNRARMDLAEARAASVPVQEPLPDRAEQSTQTTVNVRERELTRQRILLHEENLQLRQDYGMLYDEKAHLQLRERKIMWLMHLMQKRGYPVNRVYDETLKDVNTSRIEEHIEEQCRLEREGDQPSDFPFDPEDSFEAICDGPMLRPVRPEQVPMLDLDDLPSYESSSDEEEEEEASMEPSAPQDHPPGHSNDDRDFMNAPNWLPPAQGGSAHGSL